MTTEILEETVVKLKPQDIEIQNIDHLGIVALRTCHRWSF